METNREKAITRTSLIGIGANILLAAFKAAVGLISGSIAIVLDAVNNLTDAVSSVVTILGIKLSKRRPTEKHPYGYGRIEYFSTIVIAFIILAAGVTSLIESVKKIIEPEVPEYTLVAIVIIVVSIAVKLILGRFVMAQGEKYSSSALVASGKDASLDAVITGVTLLSAGITMLFGLNFDGVLGAIISLVIVKAGVESLTGALSDVMGKRPDEEISKEIKKTVSEIPGVIGAYDLALHDYGPESAIGSIHVEVPASTTAREIHTLTLRIQEAVYKQFRTYLTVGVYAVDPADADIEQTVRSICAGVEGSVNSHGIFVDHEMSQIVFDVTADFSVHDTHAFVKQIADAVEASCPGYTAKVNLDRNFSD